MSKRCTRHGHAQPCPLCVSAAVEQIKNPGGGMKLVSHGWTTTPDEATDAKARRACLALAAVGLAFQRIVDLVCVRRAVEHEISEWGYVSPATDALGDALAAISEALGLTSGEGRR